MYPDFRNVNRLQDYSKSIRFSPRFYYPEFLPRFFKTWFFYPDFRNVNRLPDYGKSITWPTDVRQRFKTADSMIQNIYQRWRAFKVCSTYILVPAAEIRDRKTGLVSVQFSWFQSHQISDSRDWGQPCFSILPTFLLAKFYFLFKGRVLFLH